MSNRKLETESFSDYMRVAKKQQDQEMKRCADYLGESFQEELLEVFRQEMLILPLPRLLEKETALMYLYKLDAREDLSLVFELYEKKEK